MTAATGSRNRESVEGAAHEVSGGRLPLTPCAAITEVVPENVYRSAPDSARPPPAGGQRRPAPPGGGVASARLRKCRGVVSGACRTRHRCGRRALRRRGRDDGGVGAVFFVCRDSCPARFGSRARATRSAVCASGVSPRGAARTTPVVGGRGGGP